MSALSLRVRVRVRVLSGKRVAVAARLFQLHSTLLAVHPYTRLVRTKYCDYEGMVQTMALLQYTLLSTQLTHGVRAHVDYALCTMYYVRVLVHT